VKIVSQYQVAHLPDLIRFREAIGHRLDIDDFG